MAFVGAVTMWTSPATTHSLAAILIDKRLTDWRYMGMTLFFTALTMALALFLIL